MRPVRAAVAEPGQRVGSLGTPERMKASCQSAGCAHLLKDATSRLDSGFTAF